MTVLFRPATPVGKEKVHIELPDGIYVAEMSPKQGEEFKLQWIEEIHDCLLAAVLLFEDEAERMRARSEIFQRRREEGIPEIGCQGVERMGEEWRDPPTCPWRSGQGASQHNFPCSFANGSH